jgi:hypothetical protein
VGDSGLASPGVGLDVGIVAALFRDHHGELVRLALLMVGDLPTAEDVVQDVYASLHSRWGKVAACEAPLPYVRAAAGWIDHSELWFLPITQPYVEFPIPAW